MKNLISFFTSLCIVILIASCDTTSSDSEFDSYRIGTWMVNSETEANWVGTNEAENAKQKADSIVINQPDGRGLLLFDAEGAAPVGHYGITFIDSTLTREDVTDVVMDSVASEIYDYGSYGWGDRNGKFVVRWFGIYDCTDDSTSIDRLQFNVIQGSDTTTYDFDVTGMHETIGQLTCEN